MVSIDIIMRDECGNVVSQRQSALDIGQGSFAEIEAAVEALKQEVLPHLEGDLLLRQQANFMAEVKKPSRMLPLEGHPSDYH